MLWLIQDGECYSLQFEVPAPNWMCLWKIPSICQETMQRDAQQILQTSRCETRSMKCHSQASACLLPTWSHILIIFPLNLTWIRRNALQRARQRQQQHNDENKNLDQGHCSIQQANLNTMHHCSFVIHYDDIIFLWLLQQRWSRRYLRKKIKIYSILLMVHKYSLNKTEVGTPPQILGKWRLDTWI